MMTVLWLLLGLAFGLLLMAWIDGWLPFTLPGRIPLMADHLARLQAYEVLNTVPGRTLMLDNLRCYVMRDQFVPNDPQATAHRCGEAAAALRMFRLMSPESRRQIVLTLLEEEAAHA